MRTTLVLAAALFALPALAQKPPVKWGKVDLADLEMSSFPADTNAAAVVLVDHAFAEVDGTGEVRMRYYRRVKLLSEAAFDRWGSFAVAYLAEDRTQRISGVKGQTLTLGDDGRVEKHKVGKRDIVKEDLPNGREVVRFTFPALEPGAIVELEYTITSDSPWFMPSWTFQDSEPVLHSEYVAEHPQTLAFVMVAMSESDGALPERTEEELTRAGVDARRVRYVARNVPALREEPFITTLEDYRSRLFVQFSAYFQPGIGERRVIESWDKLAETLRDHDSFGKRLDNARSVRDEVEAVTAGLTDPQEKLVALYDHVRTAYTYDGRRRVFMDDELRDVVRAKSGSTAELSLLLVAMLREAGLEAAPVLLSTRDNGKVMRLYPLLDQFNDVAVYARAGSAEHLLKPTSRWRPYDLMPTSNLNDVGWLVGEDAHQWIPMRSAQAFRRLTTVNAVLDADGTLSGTLETADGDYAALSRRARYEDADSPEHFARETYFSTLAGVDVTVDSARVTGEADPAQPFQVRAAFRAPQMGMPAGDFLYFQPTLAGEWSENPLKTPTRTFPVDFDWNYNMTYSARIELPEGYRLAEPVAPVRLRALDGTVSYLRQVADIDGVLQVQSRFVTGQTLFPPSRYAELRAFFEDVMASQTEPVALTNAPLPAPAPTATPAPAAAGDDETGTGGR